MAPTQQPLWRMASSSRSSARTSGPCASSPRASTTSRARSSTPRSDLLATFGLQRDAATGGFDLGPLREASEIATTAEQVIGDLHERCGRSTRMPRSARSPTRSTSSTRCSPRPRRPSRSSTARSRESGRLLGIDGPKNVVLAFLNNAEAAALGGGPAAQSLLRVDNGSVNVVQQVSSVDFADRTPLPVRRRRQRHAALQRHLPDRAERLRRAGPTSRPRHSSSPPAGSASSASRPTSSCPSTPSRSGACSR